MVAHDGVTGLQAPVTSEQQKVYCSKCGNGYVKQSNLNRHIGTNHANQSDSAVKEKALKLKEYRSTTRKARWKNDPVHREKLMEKNRIAYMKKKARLAADGGGTNGDMNSDPYATESDDDEDVAEATERVQIGSSSTEKEVKNNDQSTGVSNVMTTRKAREEAGDGGTGSDVNSTNVSGFRDMVDETHIKEDSIEDSHTQTPVTVAPEGTVWHPGLWHPGVNWHPGAYWVPIVPWVPIAPWVPSAQWLAGPQCFPGPQWFPWHPGALDAGRTLTSGGSMVVKGREIKKKPVRKPRTVVPTAT